MPALLLGLTSSAGTVDGLALLLAIAAGRPFEETGGCIAVTRERAPERGLDG
ncbi:MAG: hypothetical protein OXN94_01035 [Chloroflexota bacterium]|nr:hypothetical protein [Chloroflexota bacterium]